MKKGIKLFAASLCFLFVCLNLCGCSEEKKPLKATDKFFINDFAGVIDKQDQDEIYSLGKALFENGATKGAQVVAVTVDTTDGEDPADFAMNIGRDWGVGKSGEDNGIVILLAVDDRNVEISVGYGLEGAIPDSKAGRLLDVYAMPYLSKDDFSTGIKEVYKAVVNEVYIEYGITPDNYVSLEQKEAENGPSVKKMLISWIVLIICAILFFLIFGKKLSKGGPFGGAGGFFIGPGFGGYRGGGFRGGGGFGGFSGGGGGFGGGGAGRGF